MSTGALGPSCIDGKSLVACLRHLPHARHVPDILSRRVRAHINGLLPRLRNGIDEEIVQQTWLHLVDLEEHQIGESRDVIGLAKWFARSYAIREVLDGYTPPGKKKRTSDLYQPSSSPPLSLDADISEDDRTMGETLADSRSLRVDIDMCDFVFARIALEKAAELAPPFVARGLGLICADGLSINAAAAAVGVHHTTLTRAIARWASDAGLSSEDQPSHPTPPQSKNVAPPPDTEEDSRDDRLERSSRADLARVA